jgi:hypothetical protein
MTESTHEEEVYQLTEVLCELADGDDPDFELVSKEVSQEGFEASTQFTRRTEHTAIVSVGFPDGTLYELAMSDQMCDSLRSTFESLEEKQVFAPDVNVGIDIESIEEF